MRVFGVESDGRFREYIQTPFQVEHEEAVLEDWLETSPDGILEDGRVLVIGRQVLTNLGGYIDLLGLDRAGDVVVVELKRGRTPRDTIAQSLEYVSFAERLDTGQLEEILRSYMSDESLNLAEHHRGYFGLGADEAVAFNKDQRVVIVGQQVAPEIRQTATFLRSKGIRVTCVEFTFFQADGGTRLLSQEIVVGQESRPSGRVVSGSRPLVTESAFLASVDAHARPVFARILEVAKARAMPVHWGTKGFSLNVDVDGTHVAVFYAYPPSGKSPASLHTALRDVGGVARKSAVPDDKISELNAQAQATGLFVPAGQDLKCQLTRSLSEDEIAGIVQWCEAVEIAVREHGLKQ